MDHPWRKRLAIALFALGALLGAACAAISFWGDMEATMFDAALSSDTPLTTLRCPVMMTSAESTTVSLALGNPTERAISPFVRIHVSHGFVTLMREEDTRLPLEPGERKGLEWTVAPSDAAFGRLVLVRVHVFPSGSLPYRSAACGIVVAPFPFLTGRLLFALLVTAGFLAMGAGIALWVTTHRPQIQQSRAVTRAMGVLAAFVAAAILLGLLGAWAATLLLLLLTLLLAGVMIGYAATST